MICIDPNRVLQVLGSKEAKAASKSNMNYQSLFQESLYEWPCLLSLEGKNPHHMKCIFAMLTEK